MVSGRKRSARGTRGTYQKDLDSFTALCVVSGWAWGVGLKATVFFFACYDYNCCDTQQPKRM